nr:hypothetical protein Iba_chr11cCG11040 [Ipomoea batatas]
MHSDCFGAKRDSHQHPTLIRVVHPYAFHPWLVNVSNAPFVTLGIPRNQEERFTWRIPSCCLCVFVLPSTPSNVIRPETFRMACIMAQGRLQKMLSQRPKKSTLKLQELLLDHRKALADSNGQQDDLEIKIKDAKKLIKRSKAQLKEVHDQKQELEDLITEAQQELNDA